MRDTESSKYRSRIGAIGAALVVFVTSLVAFTWTIGFGLYVLVFGDDHAGRVWIAILPAMAMAAAAMYLFKRLLHIGVLRAFSFVILGILVANVLVYMLTMILDEGL